VGIGLGLLSIIATLEARAVALSVSGGIGAALAVTSGTTLVSAGLAWRWEWRVLPVSH